MGIGRILIVCGLILLVLGVLVTIGERLPIRMGPASGRHRHPGKKYDFLFSDRDEPAVKRRSFVDFVDIQPALNVPYFSTPILSKGQYTNTALP